MVVWRGGSPDQTAQQQEDRAHPTASTAEMGTLSSSLALAQALGDQSPGLTSMALPVGLGSGPWPCAQTSHACSPSSSPVWPHLPSPHGSLGTRHSLTYQPNGLPAGNEVRCQSPQCLPCPKTPPATGLRTQGSAQERQGDKVEALWQCQLGLFGWAECSGISI